MGTGYRERGVGYRVAVAATCLCIASVGCRSSRNTRTQSRNTQTKAPATSTATPTQEPSAKQVLSHADSALQRVSQLAAANRDAAPEAREMPEDRGYMPPPPPRMMSDVPYLPKPNLTEYGLYEAALGAYNGSRYDEALALFSRIVTTGRPPELVPNAYYWMGESLYSEKRYAESMPYFEYVVRVGPQFKRDMAMYKLSRANLYLGNKQGANTWYERLRAEYPKSSHISILRKLGAR